MDGDKPPERNKFGARPGLFVLADVEPATAPPSSAAVEVATKSSSTSKQEKNMFKHQKRASSSYQDEALDNSPPLLNELSHSKKTRFSSTLKSTEAGRKRSTYGAVAPVKKRRSLSSTSEPTNPPSAATSIQCTNIPDKFLSNEKLKRHFSRFGKVIRVQCNPKNNTATVRFESYDYAMTAKQKGKLIEGGHILNIYLKKKNLFSDRTDKSPTDNEPGRLKRPQTSPPGPSVPAKATLRRTSRSAQQGTGMVRSKPSKVVYAKTEEEKLQLLEKIDKILRSQLVKQSDLSKATVTTGTCPDMCPEKERYFRVFRSLLSTYEMDGKKKMEPSLMVKEYSRSSADQEEPLAHELRPPRVLRLAMDYMLTHMMREVDYDRTAEWYDFVWNRTRAMRKEIAIQQANNEFAMQVIEECARFHICCAHDLCEEDVTNFDPKINNENLEKTMKTVLDMYNDVHSRNPDDEGVFKNEAEFRAYFILLNMNRSADVLRELQNMGLRVRYSPEVKLALSAFSSMQSMNYSKFFNVLQRASFLQAALLHRYFAQVRDQAVSVMAKAYKSSKDVCVIPADDVMRKLHFNGVDEFEEFCGKHSIAVNKGNLELRRQGEYIGVGVATAFCSREVLAKKKGRCLGEVISHGRAPSSELHRPFSSFDRDGRYVGPHAGLLSMSVTSQKTPVKKPPPTDQTADVIKLLQRKGIPNSAIKVTARNLFVEVLGESTKKLAGEVLDSAHMEVAAVKVSEDLLKDFIRRDLRQLASNAVLEEKLAEQRRQEEAEARARKQREEAEARAKKEREEAEARARRKLEEAQRRLEELRRKEEEEKRRREKLECIERCISSLGLELEDEVTSELVRSTAAVVHREAVFALHTRIANEDLVEETVDVLLRELAASTVKEAIREEHRRIHDEVLMRRTSIRWGRWRQELAKLRKYRHACQTFPCTPLPRSAALQVRALLPANWVGGVGDYDTMPLDAQARGRLSLDTLPSLLKHRKEVVESVMTKASRISDAHLTPVPLHKIVFDNVINHSCDVTQGYSFVSNRTFWKLSLACSKPALKTGWGTWLAHKLGLPAGEDGSFLDHVITGAEYSPTDTSSSEGTSPHHVHVCCKTVVDASKLRSDLLGTSALIMFIGGEDEMEWSKVKVHLEEVLFSVQRIPRIPLLLITSGCDFTEDHLLSELCLPDYTHAISGVKLVELTDDVIHNCALLDSGLKWLASKSKPVPLLRFSTLCDVIEEQLSLHYFTPLFRYESLRLKCGAPSLDPCTIVELHNDVLALVAGVVAHFDLSDISWPAEEFMDIHRRVDASFPSSGWNSDERVNELSALVNQLQLPPFPSLDKLYDIDDLQKEVTDYVIASDDDASAIALWASEDIAAFNDRRECRGVDELVASYPWPGLLAAVAGHRLQRALYSDRGKAVVAFNDRLLARIKPNQKLATLIDELEATGRDGASARWVRPHRHESSRAVAFMALTTESCNVRMLLRRNFPECERTRKANRRALRNSNDNPIVRLPVETIHSVTMGARSNLEKLLSSPLQTNSSHWLSDDDPGDEAANQASALRMDIRSELVESRRFAKELDEEIQREAEFLSLFTFDA